MWVHRVYSSKQYSSSKANNPSNSRMCNLYEIESLFKKEFFAQRKPVSVSPHVVCDIDYEKMKQYDDLYFYFRMARKGKKPDNMSQEKAEYILNKKELANAPLDQIRDRCAELFVEEMVNNDWLCQIARSLEKAYRNDPNSKKFKSIKIIFPFSIVPDQEHNRVPKALAPIIHNRLKEFLPTDMKELNLELNIKSLAGRLTPSKNSIVNQAKNRRGNPFNRDNLQEKLINGIGKMAKQLFFTGPVEKDVLYILCDDTICTQTTLRCLGGYIIENGGTVGAIATLCKRPGAEIIDLQQETLDCLDAILAADAFKMGVSKNERLNALNSSLIRIGLHIADMKNPEKSTVSNYEAMLINAYLIDSTDEVQSRKFQKALSAVNSDLQLLAREGIGYLYDEPPGEIEKLNQLFATALLSREIVKTKSYKTEGRRQFYTTDKKSGFGAIGEMMR